MTEAQKQKLLLFIAIGFVLVWVGPIAAAAIYEIVHWDDWDRNFGHCFAIDQAVDPGCLNSDVQRAFALAVFLQVCLTLIFGGLAFQIGRWLRPRTAGFVFAVLFLGPVSYFGGAGMSEIWRNVSSGKSAVTEAYWAIAQSSLYLGFTLLPAIAGLILGIYFRTRSLRADPRPELAQAVP
jgi:hypothetical protein